MATSRASIDAMAPTDPPHDERQRFEPRRRDSFWDRQLRAKIGQDLRTLFEESLSEPVPDQLNRLIGQMERRADEDRPSGDDERR
jgi:hypothetical protein